MATKISILGSTGSIGRQTLDVIRENPEHFDIVALTAGANYNLLTEQAKEFLPQFVAIEDASKREALESQLSGLPIRVLVGPSGIMEAASLASDISLVAIVGMAGLKPTLAAIESTKCLAIANKESVVVGGRLILERAHARGVTILPVDSEHNGLYQLLEGRDIKTVSQVIITASGGPFRGKKISDLKVATLEQALKHPNWSMGPKNTIDSATLFNKGLELIEASILFNLPHERIDAWVHPESIVHGMIQLADGSLLMHASRPNMCVPIAHALFWPERGASGISSLDCKTMAKLTFEEIDHETFPAFSLARQCLDAGEWACVVYNTANEEAVQAFLDGRISFLQVMSIVQKVLGLAHSCHWKTADEVCAFAASIRHVTLKAIQADCI